MGVKEKTVNMPNGRDVEEEEAHASLGWIYRDPVQEVQLGRGGRLPKKSQEINECSKCGYAWSCSLNLDVKCRKQAGRQWNRMDGS